MVVPVEGIFEVVVDGGASKAVVRHTRARSDGARCLRPINGGFDTLLLLGQVLVPVHHHIRATHALHTHGSGAEVSSGVVQSTAAARGVGSIAVRRCVRHVAQCIGTVPHR